MTIVEHLRATLPAAQAHAALIQYDWVVQRLTVRGESAEHIAQIIAGMVARG
jgi:hypothetical protein